LVLHDDLDPARPATPPDSEAGSQREDRTFSARPTVLVVDDVPETRELLRFLLQDEGIPVVGEAGNGEQAFEQAQALRPDVVLMDMMMPGSMDGVSATRAIVEALPATKIVMLSYCDDPKLREAAFTAGAFDYFIKDQSTVGLSGAVMDAWFASRVPE
jgi:two-component system, NarL family, response regulator LiaR